MKHMEFQGQIRHLALVLVFLLGPAALYRVVFFDASGMPYQRHHLDFTAAMSHKMLPSREIEGPYHSGFVERSTAHTLC